MGAYLRFHERRTERRLAAEATSGVVPPTDEFWLGVQRQPDEAIKDRRQLIPPLGLREYWYPALPAAKRPSTGGLAPWPGPTFRQRFSSVALSHHKVQRA